MTNSDKTKLLIDNFVYDVENNNSHYKFAAITFTNKAAKDIKNKLPKSIIGHFIGTSHSFIESEIIKPFLADAVYAADSTKVSRFELALNILKNSLVSRQYIISKYKRIFIDEYQDFDKDMNELFMYIKDLNIKLFIIT
jgi:superfamily I DNA/RNA helicase